MKSVIFLAVLAALSLSLEAAAVQEGVSNRYNFVLGSTSSKDRLLYRGYYSKYGLANTVQYQDISYRGSSSTRISAVRALEVGYTQYGNVYLIAGGIGWNGATIRLQTARGYGYYYQVEFWGR